MINYLTIYFLAYIIFIFYTYYMHTKMKNNLSKGIFSSLFNKNIFSFKSTYKTINKPIFKCMAAIHSPSIPKYYLPLSHYHKLTYSFSTGKQSPLKPQQIPPENLQIAVTQHTLDNQQLQLIHTKGTLSILDKVPGPKNPQTGQLYVLMFTCGQCNAKQIKSFTKNAYHKGVVLARCVGCDKVHLVADNLGWFQDQPTNVQTLHQGKVQKVHDHAAISAFLNKAFSQQEKLLHEQNTPQDNKQSLKSQK